MKTPRQERLSRTALCLKCRMFTGMCLCRDEPRLELATKVVIFMHQKESRLITNTGVLAHRVLKNSQIVFRGHRGRKTVDRCDFLSEDEATNAMILYPSGGAETLDDDFLKSQSRPLTLICPDGNWSQARKVLQHEPSLRGIPCVKLPEGLITRYRLRRNTIFGRVCTYEAVMHALGLIEGADVQKIMATAFEKMVTRILWTRGKIPEEQVAW